MSVASGCGEQEVGVASGSGLNLWVELVGVVVRRYLKVTIICRYIFLRFWNSVHFTGIKFCVG